MAALPETLGASLVQSRLVVNLSQQLLSEEPTLAAQGATNLTRLLLSEGGIEVLFREPAGIVAVSQLGVLMQIAATKGPQATEPERHAAHASAMAVRELSTDSRGVDKLLSPPAPDPITRQTRRHPGLGACMLEGLAAMVLEPELAVVTDACAAWAHLLQSPLVWEPLAAAADRRFRALWTGLLGLMHVKGAEAMPLAAHALCSLCSHEPTLNRALSMPTLDALVVTELTSLLRQPDVVPHACRVLVSLASSTRARTQMIADAANFELLLHQLAVMMHEAAMPYAAAVLVAWAADAEARKGLMLLKASRELVTDLSSLVNPQKSFLPGPACAVLRAFSEDWSAQARVISLHGDPFILCAAVMFQVHFQQKAWASGGAEAQDEMDRTMRLLPAEVLQEPLFRNTVTNTREDAAAAMRNLLGHPDNCNFVMARGTGLRQWPDLLQGATGLLVNHQRSAGNVVTIDPLPQAAAEVLTALCASAAVRVLALEEALICETVELLLWINEWPIDAFKHKATNALFCIAGGLEDIPEEWGLRLLALLPPFLLEAVYRSLAQVMMPPDESDTLSMALKAAGGAALVAAGGSMSELLDLDGGASSSSAAAAAAAATAASASPGSLTHPEWTTNRLALKALSCVAAGRVGAYGIHRLMSEEDAENTKKLKALEKQEEKSPTDTIVSFITTAFFGSSADTGLEARAPATTPTDYPSISQPNGVLDSLLYALAEGCDTGDLRGQTVPALAVLTTCTAYEVTWRRMMSVNMSVPARIVKGVATALIAGSRTPGFRDALAVCFWFTQDALGMSFLETQHGPTLRGMLDMLVEVWKHGEAELGEMAGRTLSNMIHIGGKTWEHKLNAVHLVGDKTAAFAVAM